MDTDDKARGPAGSGRRRNPRGQGERLRTELIEAAARLLATPSLEEPLSLRAVARESRVAPQSVYLHFATKGQLVGTLIQERFGELQQIMDAADAAAESPIGKLRARCRAYCDFGLRNPGHYQLLFEARATNQLEPPGYEGSPGAAVFGCLVDGVRQCMDLGLATKDDPAVVATALWAGLHGIVDLRLGKPGFPWPPIDALVDRMLRGLVGIVQLEADQSCDVR
jgi:AcrR family transcriptional regulator